MIRRWMPALVLGGLWWWAVLRLVLRPDQAGWVEGAVAAGGWGLSLLPVHVASVGPMGLPGQEGPVGSPGSTVPAGGGRSGAGRWFSGASGAARWLRREGAGRWLGRASEARRRFTRAWRRRRSAGGPGRS
ncbi:hypothetical protein A3L22_27380 [Streptomyces griseus subsp. griseus]|nr:hypothetical protein A3L22_27380 [Streptomyces griseus subsp. griseus]